MNELHEFYADTHPFRLLTPDERKLLFEQSAINEYKPNEYVINAEESHTDADVHYFVSGVAKNIMYRSNGKQVSVRYDYPGDFIGLMFLLTEGEMNFSVQATEKAKSISFDQETFKKVMRNNNQFSNAILEKISGMMKSLYEEIKYKSDDQSDSTEPALYKRRVDSYMERPVFIHPGESVYAAAELLQTAELEGIAVSANRQDIDGMIGYREIFEALKTGKLDVPVSEVMNTDYYFVQDTDFIYDALSYLKHHPAAAVPVLHRNKPVGIIRQSSFINVSNSVYFELTYRVSNADSVETLASLSPTRNKQFQEFIVKLIDDRMYGYDIVELISSYNDRIHRQIILLAEKEMQQEGYGKPPINYCFLVMGSEGRKEQGFSTDQDNALILADYNELTDKERIENYFERLTEKINTMLAACGFPLCKGGIMAKEKKWRHSLSQWSAEIDSWLRNLDAQEVRDFTIFIDFRPIYGDFDLALELRNKLTHSMQHAPKLQPMLIKDTLQVRVPLQPFGRISTERKGRTLNLKQAAIMQVVNTIRIYSVANGVDDVHSVARLRRLTEGNIMHPTDSYQARKAMHELLIFRLKLNLKQLQEEEPLTTNIPLKSLSKEERNTLKESLATAKRLQQGLELRQK